MGIRDMDEDQLRSGSAVLLGACFIMLPVLVGRMGVPTLLIVSAIGGLAILPVWRYAGGSLSSPSILTYLGAWGCTLGFMRFATGWRDTE